jgi:flagellar biogenesis protein FliO
MRRLWLSVVVALSCCLLGERGSYAVEPAGGPPEPASVPNPAPVSSASPAPEQPDASTGEDEITPLAAGTSAPERSWLAPATSAGDERTPSAGGVARHSGLTLGAVVIILGLGVAAVILRQKRRKLAPIAAMESRLDILSSSRLGPKAYAVTAHVGGRVMLLGVTDHTVTHLCWIDQPDPGGSSLDAESRAVEVAEERVDDLPDDYPGSALRAAARNPTQLASLRELRRFQDVLRGAIPRGTTARHAEELPSAASALAAQTSDVLMASLSGSSRGATPASLRRKRQRRLEHMSAPASPAAAPRRADAADPGVEGQVAGLRALRNG